MDNNINENINNKNAPTGMRKKTALIMLFLFIIVLLFLFMGRGKEDSWICVVETGWTEHGKPSSVKPTTPCTQTEREQVVEKYLKENISDLSPEKEVLGGKFYVTSVSWVDNDSGIVAYEDGHIALIASFDYEILIDTLNDTYSVTIKDFTIIPLGKG